MAIAPLLVRERRRVRIADARDEGRHLDVSWHDERRLVVLSLWHGETCRATFQLPVENAPALMRALTDALTDALADHPAVRKRPHGATPSTLDRLLRQLDRIVEHVGPRLRRAQRAAEASDAPDAGDGALQLLPTRTDAS